ncbi:hypothetical protein B0H16DRAFT_1628241 [Mycena metata]|uniref:Uncharacterized protein n=1 Tax=Mycena metata TaxID=1033252 RepID=A0AAD7MDN1_9AGAR|nr:hypothetical protein B0H16DRAFT_1628241 [Mycena metata]
MTSTTMNYTVNSSSFDSGWSALSTSVIDVCVQLVLYGIYLVLFILAIHTLTRRKSGGKKLLLGYTWTMIVFGTVQLVVCLVQAAINVRCVEVLVKQDVAGNLTSQPELARLALLDKALTIAQFMVFAVNKYVHSL